MTEVSKDYLDSFARKYYLSDKIYDIDVENTMQDESISQILKKMGEPNKILEMGVGVGTMLKNLYEREIFIDIVEGSELLIENFENKYPQTKFFHTLFENFKPDYKYDCIFAFHVFEHVENPEQLIKIVENWLEPGGKLIIIVPNKNSYHRILGVTMNLHDNLDDLSDRDLLVGHLRVYGMDELLDLVNNNSSLEVIDKFGNFFKPLPNKYLTNLPKEVLEGLNRMTDIVDYNYLCNIGLVCQKLNE